MTKPQDSLLTEQEIIAAPESDYMNDDQLRFFEHKLEMLYESTCARIEEAKESIVAPMEFSDDNDRASSEEQSAIALRIVDREQKLLPKIRKTLKRLREGDYGYCQESGEPIGIRRLIARPTAEYCAEVKAQKELKERQFRDF